jgi:lambda family phage portal protein
MNLFRWLVNRLRPPSSPAPPAEVARSDEPLELRRWDAARTDRHNSAHWARATGKPLNADLAGSLRSLRARCCYEASNNPIVEGLLHTHADDVVGPHGPTLQILSDSPEYNAAAQDLWASWWTPPVGHERPDAAGQLTGPELLRQAVWLWWTKGEHLWQLTSAGDVPADQLALRIQAIDPDRLDTSPAGMGDPAVALGVRRNRTGRPIAYQISAEQDIGPFRILGTKFEEYPAEEILHQFEQVEPGQVRGFPWLSSSLQSTADLRDFDRQVMDAARLAASQGVLWYTDHPDATYWEVQETVDFERNQERTGPPGWKPMMVDSKQPQANYVAFRTERMRELGRGRSIPLMKILLGSERHNFASARMDILNYQRSLESLQRWTERMTLEPLLAAVLREGALLRRRGRFLLPPRPPIVWATFHWQKQPAVDPVKEANATTIRLANGTLPFAAACAEEGRDEDDVIASRAESNKKLAAAGLPEVGISPEAAAAAAQSDLRDGAGGRGGPIDPADDGFDEPDLPEPDPEEIYG